MPPKTRSQTKNNEVASLTPKKITKHTTKKNFVDSNDDNPIETANALSEVKKICKKLQTPKISTEILDNTTDSDYTEDTDYNTDDTLSEVNEDDVLESIEQEMKNVLGEKKYEEYLKIKKALADSNPSITSLIDLDCPIQEKVRILEDFMIYVSEPIGPLKYEQKQKLNRMLKPINPELRKLKDKCPDLSDYIEEKIIEADTIDANKIILYQKYQIYRNTHETDERNSLESWFRLALSLPYNKIIPTPIEGKIKHLAEELDRRLYGLDKFKTHILVEINKFLHNPNNTRNIALMGPPGIGKTSIIKIVSESIGIPFYSINVGGIDIDSLIGCNFVYRGAHEGEITRALRSFKQSNGFIYFDEYEKIGGDDFDMGSRDSAAVQTELLRITDKTQNSRYKDLYLMGLEQNLSNVLFFFSMNSRPRNTALLDRLTVIEMEGYNHKEKMMITRRHLIPEALKQANLTSEDIKFDDTVLNKIMTDYADDKGVRQIESIIIYIVNQIYFLMTNEGVTRFMKDIKITKPMIVTEDVYYEIKKTISTDKKWHSYFS